MEALYLSGISPRCMVRLNEFLRTDRRDRRSESRLRYDIENDPNWVKCLEGYRWLGLKKRCVARHEINVRQPLRCLHPYNMTQYVYKAINIKVKNTETMLLTDNVS